LPRDTATGSVRSAPARGLVTCRAGSACPRLQAACPFVDGFRAEVGVLLPSCWIFTGLPSARRTRASSLQLPLCPGSRKPWRKSHRRGCCAWLISSAHRARSATHSDAWHSPTMVRTSAARPGSRHNRQRIPLDDFVLCRHGYFPLQNFNLASKAQASATFRSMRCRVTLSLPHFAQLLSSGNASDR